MKRANFSRALAQADREGVWAFTPETFSALLGGVEPNYLRLMLKRLVDRGVLARAARGVYVNPAARSLPADVRVGLIRFLRPRELTYISLETKLSAAGVISQIPATLTCMTTGQPGKFDTPWGIVEFTHTDHRIEPGADVYFRDDGMLEATTERAVRDLRRVGRNVGLIDEDVLAEVLAEEKDHGVEVPQP